MSPRKGEIRRFKISPDQYELFKFQVPEKASMRVRMIATAPVNLMLLDGDERTAYESGETATHEYEAAWGRKSDLDATVKVAPGTWYLVVEGSTEPSSGRVEVFLRG